MADAPNVFDPPRWLELATGPFASRPRLLGAVAFGIAVGLGLAFIPNGLSASTRALLSWDAACGFFIVTMLMTMRSSTEAHMRARARVQDEGQHVILFLVLAAAIISIGAIAKELSLAKADHDVVKLARVSLGFLTVAASWFMVQLIFALHYAHEYYAPDEKSPEGKVQGGLNFPDDDTPDYWDFLHFAVVIGVASQTADVAFNTKPLRRIGTVHGMISFLFNTVVLALTINLLAGLF